MYICPRTYIPSITDDTPLRHRALLIVPTEPELRIERFVEIVESIFEEVNVSSNGPSWELRRLNVCKEIRTPENNYSEIYNSDLIIIECTDKKPNIFYMLGLAHSCGLPVCCCYCNTRESRATIPFNVHGRQSLTYSISSFEDQRKWANELREWIIECG